MSRPPAKTDPQIVARKLAAAPGLRLPPPPKYDLQPDGRVANYRMQDMPVWRKARNRIGQLLYNFFVTFIPSHHVRLAYLRLFGAKLGKGVAVNRCTTILDIEFLTIGDDTTVGARCMLDARAGLYLGNNVILASDVHVLGGGHDINHPDFLPVPNPTVIEDYAWIASRAMILPSHIGRGAVVAAQSVVIKDVGEYEVVGGNPAKVIAKRNPEALKYSGRFRAPFW
ncbi:colanic acid biosynthesis acetyltransferase WcaF [Mycolicibacterium phlei]|uniref:Acetyltransferase n=1 Tax=Mycolicibacterium phlei DSM 43239 = CCUG 21000 TaxID=1226750 RepID=A0A5N5V7R8_MYCPH|nr:acyltransferase [Mycolicibacterium phlei]VEG08539.1 colanic acid biosynthesis acetyltransferase WcaF [Mycobacteroides chelonae]AMO60419.1 Maltose O-acetyltransferase [Mycolicibacterium phlei]EID17697.1 acetyltransferase [Mycolicibacterium phlei RIVM601174]KAB7756549.1 acetyltransferase [Mycolicibacterium phlei DSM 43239 = CCUG 21000]KXW61975.1 acetyltransferase [Mycolicibacterium phlei DSM 43072]